MVSPGPPAAGPGDAVTLAAALIVAIPGRLLPRSLIAAILAVVPIAVRPVLIEACALSGLTIAVAHVLAAILIPARSPLFPLLILVSFLIGHDIPPRP